jgi:hypothetical protein
VVIRCSAVPKSNLVPFTTTPRSPYSLRKVLKALVNSNTPLRRRLALTSSSRYPKIFESRTYSPNAVKNGSETSGWDDCGIFKFFSANSGDGFSTISDILIIGSPNESPFHVPVVVPKIATFSRLVGCNAKVLWPVSWYARRTCKPNPGISTCDSTEVYTVTKIPEHSILRHRESYSCTSDGQASEGRALHQHGPSPPTQRVPDPPGFVAQQT